MQIVAGSLMDEATSVFIEQPDFQNIVSLSTQQITADFREKYGVTIAIHADQPRQQAGRCQAATLPERLPTAPPSNVQDSETGKIRSTEPQPTPKTVHGPP